MSVGDAYDVIVLGAGAGGMASALVAARQNLRVLLVEKTALVGGTTAISGGMVWIPANDKNSASDTREAGRTYLRQTVRAPATDGLREAFLAHGPEAIAWLEAHSALRFAPVARYPDYYPDLDGATLGGRVLEPLPYDGRRLGDAFARLRPPLPEFTLLGGMMVARADMPHFRNVFRAPRSALRVAQLVTRHAVQRLRHPRGTSLVLGNALAARLFRSVLDCGAELRLRTTTLGLAMEGGVVAGIEVATVSGIRTIHARRGVVLATGGFGHSTVLRRRFGMPDPDASAAVDSATGDGITLGLTAGGAHHEGAVGNAFFVPISRFRRGDGSEGTFPHTVTDRSKPGLIAVDDSGRRFTNEARSYHDVVRAMIAKALERAWLISDSAFVWRYGIGAVRPLSFSVQRWVDQDYLRRGSNLSDLANSIGINPQTLAATVSAYNRHAVRGEDPEFGRGGDAYQRHLGDAEMKPNPCVAPIVTPPFYAVEILPGDLGTAAGLATDAVGRVLDSSGSPIQGLYSVGNDMASIMEGAYPGPGITLGPALTFAYLAAMHMAE